MRTLIVDNGSKWTERLHMLAGADAEVMHWDELPALLDAPTYDLLILSGGSEFPVLGNEERLAREIALVQATETPVVGICFGAELIAHAYGANLRMLAERERGMVECAVLPDGVALLGDRPFVAYESHRWVIEDLPESFAPLARSTHGIEAFRHRDKPMWGMQFHPEVTVADDLAGRFLRKIFATYH